MRDRYAGQVLGRRVRCFDSGALLPAIAEIDILILSPADARSRFFFDGNLT
jgi:hypothetical protein